MLGEDVDADLFGIAEDELAASVQHFIVRGGRIRGIRTLDGRQGARRRPAASSSRPCCSAPTRTTPTRRARCSCPSCRRTRRSSRPGSRSAAPRAASRGRRGAAAPGSGSRSAARRPRSRRPPARNAAQALMLHKTRRTSDYVARSQALTDLQDALGLDEAPLRIECYDVSHLARHEHRRLDGRLRGRPAAQGPVPAVQRRRVHRRHRLDVPGAAPPARASRATRSPAPAAQGERFAYRPQLLVVDGGQPQVAAAPARSKDAGVTGLALVRPREAARGDLAAGQRLPGHPAPQLATRCSCCSGSATRRTASRSRTSAAGEARHRLAAGGDPGSRRGAGARCCCATSARWRSCARERRDVAEARLRPGARRRGVERLALAGGRRATAPTAPMRRVGWSRRVAGDADRRRRAHLALEEHAA